MGLALASGCGPSEAERADRQVARLTEQASEFFEMGMIDRAEETVQEALAVPSATRNEAALALLEKIRAKRHRLDTEKFNRETAPLLAEVKGLIEKGDSTQAVEWVQRHADRAQGVNKKLAEALLHHLRIATSEDKALELWARSDTAQLKEHAGSATLPEQLWLETWGENITNPTLREVWRDTVQKTLPVAIAKSEAGTLKRPEPSADSRRGDETPPLVATIEEVNAQPEQWYGKTVVFDNVWIHGKVTLDKDYGFLFPVTSAAGKRFSGVARGDRLVFATYPDIAKQLKKQVRSKKDKVRAKVSCEIVRARKMGLTGLKSFPKAMVYKVGVYEDRAP
jgi:hypothetical protein